MQALKPEQPVHGNEEAIIISFREGNKEAFRVVYDRMARPLLYFVENIIHSEPDAEDIVANAFYKLFHSRNGMKSFEHIKRWLYVIVRNEAIDYLRLKTRQRESQNDLAYLDPGVEEHIETERVRTILLQDIHREIEKLPRQRKTILRLYFFEQKNTSEIAEIMQLSPQTVLNHKTKALDALRKSGLKVRWLLDGVPSFLFAIAFAFYLLK
ncbi:MAG TPA: sigma-70 family RNA polymerase sigma factor [Puia sp.]|nr:sigma-70 family RNA polymerase sigma factor [Puia sp.]